MVPEHLRYTKEHEWILLENGKAKIGVTDFAQQQLGDIVYLDLPKNGSTIKQMSPCGVIESVKAVSEIYAPVSGTVIEVNSNLNESPQDVNQDPYGKGWMFVVHLSDIKEKEKLLSAKDYNELVKT